MNHPNAYTTEPDKTLVDAYKQHGDAQVLAVLYQRYMDLVFGICLKYFKDAERSKDAVMDIYEELTNKLRQHNVDYFRGWLSVVARNHCLMQLRSPKNLKTGEYNPNLVHSAQAPHLENEALEKEAQFVLLEDCIGTLPPDQKHSIELFYLQKKCYQEIAQITGHEWNKVRSHIQNGKRNLKICIEQKQTVNS